MQSAKPKAFYTDKNKKVRPIFGKGQRRKGIPRRLAKRIEASQRNKALTSHGNLPNLKSERKIELRKDAAKEIDHHDVVLELHAGKGNISKACYMKISKNMHILVDHDPFSLGFAKMKLGTGPKKLYIAKNNERFIEEDLHKYQGRITLVDFDPYGGCGKIVQKFFDHYKVTRPMIVTLTDGSVADWRNVTVRDFYEHYLSKKVHPKISDMANMIENMMNKLGERHGFKVKKLGEIWKEDKHAYYVAYLLKPSR